MASISIEKIKARLSLYNYAYAESDNTLSISLPFGCYLLVTNKNSSITIYSGINWGFSFIPLEANFILYALATIALAYKFPGSYITVLCFCILLLQVGCIIKLESMKIILHQWMEADREKI